MTFTKARPGIYSGNEGDVPTRISIPWTSSAGGAYTEAVSLPSGFIMRVVTVPSATSAPTADYDITLIDPLGAADVLDDALANRHTSNTEIVQPVPTDWATPAWIYAGSYTFTVANAGDTKAGTCYIDMLVNE